MRMVKEIRNSIINKQQLNIQNRTDSTLMAVKARRGRPLRRGAVSHLQVILPTTPMLRCYQELRFAPSEPPGPLGASPHRVFIQNINIIFGIPHTYISPVVFALPASLNARAEPTS
ncbi:hypothetical protein EVAR_37475_1 [Eumeta japonica]|uniref:Uncharacterized protein n=1 Tax=Eumeta variegata TaxID=151549 RepID=A0A4C1XBE4_EUMVA|nr:hypothetical protein EVAR_37475_1 [Eumeta japonica]